MNDLVLWTIVVIQLVAIVYLYFRWRISERKIDIYRDCYEKMAEDFDDLVGITLKNSIEGKK